ncbi:MAG: MarR family transcriptional regulator [Magnetovibrio sp.]|nr:MarR family transcriptional regulator [Magnetovibrio sp.]
MSDPSNAKNALKLTDRAMLSLLAVLETGEPVTQRSLAARIGVALGLANGLVKRAVRKGLVKVKQAPAKRYAYYVTPQGFGENSRLVAQYLSSSLDFFRQAREEFAAVYVAAEARGHTRVVLFGAGELAEIAMLSAQDSAAEVLAVVQPGSNQSHFSGLPVISSLDAPWGLDVDAVVITCADAPQAAYELLREHFDDERIIAAPLLHINRQLGGGQDQ